MSRKPKARKITLAEFQLFTDAELEARITEPWSGFFPGKENCTPDGKFYLHDGGYYNFLTGRTEGWRD